MRQIKSNKILGVALTDQGFLVAEVVGTGASRQVRHSGEFKFPQGKSIADLAALGRPFGQYLKQHGFTAKRLVVGLPASWVMVRPKEVPPSDPATAASILRMQAETDFSSDLKDLVFDYAGETDKLNARTVLVMAVPKERITQIEDMAVSARLSLDAIVPSSVALAVVCKPLVAPEGLIIYAGPRSVELTFHSSRGLHRMRSATLVSSAPVAAAGAEGAAPSETPPADKPLAHELAAELRRTLVSLPQNGTPASARKLVFWDGVGLDAAARDFISQRLGLPLEARGLSELGVTATDPDAARFVPAVALALAATSEAGLPVEFLKSRLAPPKKGWDRRMVSYVVFAAVLLAIGIGWLVVDTMNLSATRADLDAWLTRVKPEITRDDAAVKKLKFATSWYGTQPKLVYLLRYITDAYPTNNGNAWTTNLEVNVVPEPGANARPTDAKGPPPGSFVVTLTAKATTADVAKQVVDNMKASGHFKDVKGPELNVNARTREVAFGVSFTYIPAE